MKLSDQAIRDYATTYGTQFHLQPAWVYAIILGESFGDPDAENRLDPSMGLMGVTPLIGRAYAKLVGNNVAVLAALKDIHTNLTAGCGYLVDLNREYGSKFPLQEWIQSYNLGEPHFNKGERNPAYGDTVGFHIKQWEENNANRP